MTSLPVDDRLEVRLDAFVEDPACHLFNTPAFFQLHAAGRGVYFQLCRRQRGDAVATLHFTEVAPGTFRSPARGTYGAISAAPDVPPSVLETFLDMTEQTLVARGARELHVLLPPASHDLPMFSISTNLFLRRGYTIERHELGYDLSIDERPLAARMESGNRKRFNKCVREGFLATQLAPVDYRRAYDVIAGNRLRRGYPVTMTFEDVMRMAEVFPDRVTFFGVSRGEDLVAAAVCMAVSREVLYVFSWGDTDGMQDHSPVTLLASAIYDSGQAKGFKIVDAGISTVDGEPNQGLIRFKRGLGFGESLKLTFAKRIAADA